MTRYRFALRPRWILSHLLVLALIAAMVAAGLWQVDRHDEKRERNARIASRTTQPIEPVEDLLADPGASTDELEYRVVSAEGRYLGPQILVRSRSLDGSPGSWVITPLELDSGTVVIVNRGFMYNSGEFDTVPDSYAAPDGEVQVVGLLRKTQTRGRIGAADSDTGVLENMARLDVERISQQIDAPVLPMYLSLEDQRPQLTTADPVPIPREPLDEGPHRGYAVQWFIFTTIGVIGYPLILRRRAKESGRDRAETSAPDPVEPA